MEAMFQFPHATQVGLRSRPKVFDHRVFRNARPDQTCCPLIISPGVGCLTATASVVRGQDPIRFPIDFTMPYLTRSRGLAAGKG